MVIRCTDIAKIYRKEAIFSGFSAAFMPGSTHAILGPNSSGKSTLLKVIAGLVEPSSGTVAWETQHGEPLESPTDHLSFCSPELDLFPDFEVGELVGFHFSLKQPKLDMDEFWSTTGLTPYKHKTYSQLSSGLQNKVKLALALCTQAPVLLLDEPCTNFDAAHIDWYHEMIGRNCADQLIIIASNQQHEYSFCENRIDLNHFKNA